MLGTKMLQRVLGTSKERDFKRHKGILDEVATLEPVIAAMSNDTLRAQTRLFKQRLSDGESLDDILPEAFATVRETAKRVIGLRPHDAQMYGAVVLHKGGIAEMMTGEGKTLVATMPLYLNALDGRGVHLVTVNDYLARRDSQWMGPIFEFLGLTVGLIQHGMDTYEKQYNYRCDITYGTNNEYGFDYLRDNMVLRTEMRMQRQLNYAIVDEVDSILIDEARTPLIISGRPEKSTDLYFKVDEAIRKLKKDTHYELEEKGNYASLTEDGMAEAERLMGVENLYTDDSLGIVHMIEQSLKAHNFYKRDDEYMVQNNEVVIVDEFTGRLQEGRRYGDGLHQAIEAKERVPVQFETQTVASVSYQNFFKLYNKLAGMTGTAMTEAQEFATTYGLEVFAIDPNLPLMREDRTDLIFATEQGKFKYVVDEIAEIHETNRPILVGTVSIEKSEMLAKMLTAKGVEGHQVLNAKQHEREASIIASAGKPGAITIATNMAGRGTDIKLAEGVRENGGLAIVGTERHESRRIDNQLRGRAGRQGDPGTTRFYVSLEDEVARLFGGDKVKKVIGLMGGDAMDDEPLDQKMVTRSIEKAQTRVEEHNFEIRKQLVKYDDVMNKQRQVIYKMRRDVLEDRDVSEQIRDMMEEMVYVAVDEYAPKGVAPEEWDVDGLAMRLKMIFHIEPDMTKHTSGNPDEMAKVFVEEIKAEYDRRESVLAEELKKSYLEQGGKDDTNIDFAQAARKRMHELEKMCLLKSVDDKWIVHLYSMDYLRESVRMRALGQRDPLLEYKQEAYDMFNQLLVVIYEGVMQSLFRMSDPEQQKKSMEAAPKQSDQKGDPLEEMAEYDYVGGESDQSHGFANLESTTGNGAAQSQSDQRPKPNAKTVKRVGEKPKPNAPCTCGSGKKYKKCCGANN